IPLKSIRGAELEILKDNYEDLWKFIVATKKEDYATRKKIYNLCTDFFRAKGKYSPEPPAILRETEPPGIKSILNQIKQEKPAAFKVLMEISGEKPVSSEEIAKNVNISRSTVSQYLNYLVKLFNSYENNELKISKKGRKKLWWIENKVSREIIRRVGK
ncbi:MAG: HTH domain-containing protein, partial [Thermoplasmata archaeon]|nr:HTH domain-containing protein [Thermoplasmata archaeon]